MCKPDISFYPEIKQYNNLIYMYILYVPFLLS